MADKYDVSATNKVLEALIDPIASRSAPIYIDAVLGTADDGLTISNVEALPDNVKDLWRIQYEAPQSDSRDEWYVLSLMKLSYNLNLPYYSKLVRTIYLELLSGDRGWFRKSVEQLKEKRQWIDIRGGDLVARQTQYYIHDIQLEAIQVRARGDASELSDVLLSEEESLPTYTQPIAHLNAGAAFSKWGRISLAIDQWKAALDLDSTFPEVHFNYGLLLAMHQGIPTEAETIYIKQLSKIQNFWRHTIAMLYYFNSHYLLNNEFLGSQGAKQHFESALQLEPQNADIHYEYGTFLKGELNQAEEGEWHLSTARSINPEEYKGANIEIPKYPQNLSVETKKQSVSPRPVAINFGAEIPRIQR